MKLVKMFVWSLILLSFELYGASLIAHWSFDDINNNMVPEMVYGNKAFITGSNIELHTYPGLFDDAFYIDEGSHSIEIPHSVDMNLTNDFTVEFVIKPFKVDGFRTILWKGSRSGDPDIINYNFDIRDGKVELKAMDSNGLWRIYSTSPVLTANNWYHIVYRFLDGECQIYVNGSSVSVIKGGDAGVQIGNSLLTNGEDSDIGSCETYTGSQGYLFDGLIDDIKIWSGSSVNFYSDWTSRVAENDLLMQTWTPTGASPQLVAHWDFNDVNNNTAPDSAGTSKGYIQGDLVDRYVYPGVFGESFYFNNGLHSANIPHSTDISLSNDFTFEYVIMPFSVDSYRTIFWKGDRTGEPDVINYLFDIHDGRFELKCMDTNGLWTVFLTTAIMTTNNWYHVICYYKDGECELFVNGEKITAYKSVAVGSQLGDSLLENTNDGVIGICQKSYGANGYYFNGLIDDIKIWQGRAVNPGIDYRITWPANIQNYQQIMQIWTPNTSSSAPAVHWNFDSITDNTLASSLGNCDGYIDGGSVDKYVRPGLLQKSFYFDNGKHPIEIQDSSDISLSNNFTVEYIIMPFSVDGYRTIFWKGDRSDEPDSINYYFDINDGKIELKAKNASNQWTIFSSAAILSPSNWYHVIIYYNDGQCYLYVNGERKSVTKSEEGPLGNSLLTNNYIAEISVGRRYSGIRDYLFDGLIDDLKIWPGRVLNSGIDYRYEWQQLIDGFNQEMAAIAQAEAEITQTAATEYVSFYNLNQTDPNATFLTTVLPASYRLVYEPMFFESISSITNTAQISAAQNEYEGFQVICLGRPVSEYINVTISCSALTLQGGTETIPTSNISVGSIKTVATEVPDIPVDFTGSIPDVIHVGRTTFKVYHQSFTSVFVKVYTGNATPGTYTGTITLTNGSYQKQLAVELEVYNFKLPEKGSLRMAFSFFEDYYKQWYDLSSIPDTTKSQIYDFLLSYRLSPCNIYTSESLYPAINFLNTIKDQKNFFTIKGWSYSVPVTTTVLNDIINQTTQTINSVTAAGLEDDMYYTSYDELIGNYDVQKLAAVAQINGALMNAFPTLRMMQTSFPETEIEDLFNVWVPLMDYFRYTDRLQKLDTMRLRGDEIWWYGADRPNHPFPNYFLDYPVFDCRIVPLLSYMYDIQGVLYWCINREWATNMDIKSQWPSASWKPYIYSATTGLRKYKNGMGNLVYPGSTGELFPSLRLENLRDGLEDYEYLTLLKSYIERAKIVEGGTTPLISQAEALLAVPANVATAVNSYSADPQSLLNYRDDIAAMIEQLNIPKYQ